MPTLTAPANLKELLQKCRSELGVEEEWLLGRNRQEAKENNLCISNGTMLTSAAKNECHVLAL